MSRSRSRVAFLVDQRSSDLPFSSPGVIGGVAFLLLSLLALLFFLRRRRRSKEQYYEAPMNGHPPIFNETKTPDQPNPSSSPSQNQYLPEVQSPYDTSPHSQARHSVLLSASPPPESNFSHSTSQTLVDRHASPGMLSSSGEHGGGGGGSLAGGRFNEEEGTPPGRPMSSAAARGTDQRRSVWSEGEGRFVNEVSTVAGRR